MSAQDAFEKGVNLLAAGAGEAQSVAGVEEFSHLGEGEMFGMLHGDLHSPALCPDPACSSSGSSCVGNTPPLQAHLALDNSGGLNRGQQRLPVVRDQEQVVFCSVIVDVTSTPRI